MKSIARSDVTSVASSRIKTSDDLNVGQILNEDERLYTKFIESQIICTSSRNLTFASSDSGTWFSDFFHHVPRFGNRECAILNAASDYVARKVIIIILRKKRITDGDRWSIAARYRVMAVRVDTCIKWTAKQIDRDNSIADASDASNSGFYLSNIVHTWIRVIAAH